MLTDLEFDDPDYGYFNDKTMEEIHNKQREGFTIIYRTPTTLLLDLDTGEDAKRYWKSFSRLQKIFKLKEVDRWLSKSGNTHVVVQTAEKLSPLEALVLEAALGSDPVRAAIGIKKIKNGYADNLISVLFKPPVRKENNEIDDICF